MQKSKVKIVELKCKIQKKGDLKMKKTGFYLPTLFCAALLCLGTASYVKAEEGATLKGDFIPPGLNKQAKHKWLKNHPAVAAKLANNPKWLKKHPKVAKKLFSNKKWLAAHPRVARAMYRNKQWVKNHPKIAKRIYNNKKFLAKHPGIAKRVKKRADINKDGRVDAKERGIARRKDKGVRDHGKGLGKGKGRGSSQRRSKSHNKGGGKSRRK